jgi:hypothetical protein
VAARDGDVVAALRPVHGVEEADGVELRRDPARLRERAGPAPRVAEVVRPQEPGLVRDRVDGGAARNPHRQRTCADHSSPLHASDHNKLARASAKFRALG